MSEERQPKERDSKERHSTTKVTVGSISKFPLRFCIYGWDLFTS